MFYVLATFKVISGWVLTCDSVYMMGDVCHIRVTGCRSVVMEAPLASSGLAKCESVVVGGRGLYRVVTVHTHSDFIVLPHWETRLQVPCPEIPLSHIILSLSQPVLALA